MTCEVPVGQLDVTYNSFLSNSSAFDNAVISIDLTANTQYNKFQVWWALNFVAFRRKTNFYIRLGNSGSIQPVLQQLR